MPKHYRNICILRLSALGDVANCLPSLRTIQVAHPQAKITWIIGKIEYQLVKDIDKINFVVVDKNQFIKSWILLRALPKFEVVLHMQASLRSSLLLTAINSNLKIGLDTARSKDKQHWFCNEMINPRANAHTLETYLDFALKIDANIENLIWNLPLTAMLAEAKSIKLPAKFMVISPCSSKDIRNWTPIGYAEVSLAILKKYQIPCVLTGGNSRTEYEYGQQIIKLNPNVINLIGKTSLRQMVAILAQAELLIAPDSGPVHIATATGTKVIGLYANTNPDRAGPYLSQQWLVNQYPSAVKKYLHQDITQIKFGTRVRHSEVMQLITTKMVMTQVAKILA